METTTTTIEKFEKLPKIITKQDSNTSDCIIPYIDKSKNNIIEFIVSLLIKYFKFKLI